LENSVDICRSADEVFDDYCSDPLREAKWNPRLEHIEKATVGPVEVGAHMTIEVVRFDRPNVWATVGESARLRGSLEGRVLSTSDGAQLVLRMEIEPKGALRLLLGPIGRRMHHAQRGHLATIRRRLETAGPAASELPSERTRD
jgi:hypothetical protein